MNTEDRSHPTTTPEPPAGRRATILCVDDDPNIAEALARRLRPYGVDVLRAYQGVQGLWQAVTEKPDLIILDLAMPGGSGDEILDVLQENEQTAGTPVLVLSGNLHRSLSRQLEKHGAVRCFCKPLPFEELLAEIRRFVPAVA